jgi:PII-like signaling protein
LISSGTPVINVFGSFAIKFVVSEGKINAFLPALDGMMGGGLVTLEKVKVIHYRSGPGTAA